MALAPTITDYRDQVLKVEPKGIEPIAAPERHGRPSSAFTLWFGANVEFATLTTGVLATALFGLSFAQAAVAIVVGNLIGSTLLGVLSTYGPRLGTPQMVQSRAPFGYFGNFLPGALNFVAGFSWFAVNTVLGVFALDYLLHVPFGVGLAVMVVAQVAVAIIGHNLIHSVERWLVLGLTVVFVLASIWGFSRGHLSAPFNKGNFASDKDTGAFIATISVTLSYVLGWIPYASDYTRYLPESTSRTRVFGNVFLAMFISGVWLEMLGAALGTRVFVSLPSDLLTGGALPHWVAVVTFVGVVFGTVTANALNIYSGALSALVLNIPMPRWVAALVVGAAGTALSVYAEHGFYAKYETFLFLLGYWIAPWLAILLIDLATRADPVLAMYDRRRRFGVGFLVWLVSIAVSVPFMDQSGSGFVHYVGAFASRHAASVGDITYYVSFAVAFLLYGLSVLVLRQRGGSARPTAAA